jgi:hypothetical protein
MEEQKWFDFDKVEVPFDLGTAEFLPSEEMWSRYRRVMDEEVVFITNAMRPRAMVTYRLLPPPPGEQHINAGHDAQYFNRPVPGKKLILRSRIVDKYIRRGRPYLITETEVHDEDGLPIEKFKRTSMVKSSLLGRKWWAKPTRATEIGAELESVIKDFTLDSMREFEAIYGLATDGELDNYHSDADAANTAGLKQPIASAHMTISYMHDLLNRFFGHGWVEGGRLNLKFIRPTLAGDRVTYKGRLTDKVEEGEKVRLVLDVWTENQRGQQTAAGQASALVD